MLLLLFNSGTGDDQFNSFNEDSDDDDDAEKVSSDSGLTIVALRSMWLICERGYDFV